LSRQFLPLHPEAQVTIVATEDHKLEKRRKQIAKKVKQDHRVYQ
jgi:hypothetical protein